MPLPLQKKTKRSLKVVYPHMLVETVELPNINNDLFSFFVRSIKILSESTFPVSCFTNLE